MAEYVPEEPTAGDRPTVKAFEKASVVAHVLEQLDENDAVEALVFDVTEQVRSGDELRRLNAILVKLDK